MKLFFRKTGEGQPLLILHGLFGQSDNWSTLAKEFARFSCVYTIDLRNHGLSPHSGAWTYPAMSDDLLELLEAEGLEKATLLGHSLGGKAAMHFALHHSEKVNKLIVVDISPRDYPAGQDRVIEGLQAVDLKNITSRKEAEEQLSRHIADVPTKQFLLKNLYRPQSGESFAWRFNLKAIAENRGSIGDTFNIRGKQFAGPVLFLAGEHADYIRKEDEALIKSHFPEALIQTIPGAGHWIHADKPREFAAAVEMFFQSLA